MEQKPIRVLQVLTAMNRAGAETMLMNLYRAVDRERVQFDFAVSTKDHCDYDDEILSLGGRIICYPRYTGKNHFAYKKWWHSFFAEHTEYKIVHGHVGSTASIYLKIAKKHGCYTIAHSHSTGSKGSFHNTIYRLYAFPTRYIADYFIGCSTEALISRFGKRIALDKSCSCVLNNGIDIARYTIDRSVGDDVRHELGIGQDEMVIGTVGRFTNAKNPFFIVDILDALKRRGESFRFIWAGTGEQKEDIEKYIAEKGLGEEILMIGVRNDIPRILQAMNLFILPSKFEGLPVIGVETQAAGVPMLCSDRVSPEMNMSNCVTFLPIDSVEPWVNGILREKVFRRIMNAPGDVVAHGYDVNSTAQWLTEFYERNAAGPQSIPPYYASEEPR